MRELVIRTVSKVMEVAAGQVNDDSSTENIVTWDSLKHMNLILALEEEFGVTFSDEQIIELKTVREIIITLEELVADVGRQQ